MDKMTDGEMTDGDRGLSVGFIIGLIAGLLIGYGVASLANAAEPDAIDSTMVINCRDVPDKWLMTYLDRDALYGADEWGEWTVIEPAKPCECPAGTRKKYGLSINASDPPSQWVECWTVKTVCDTMWEVAQ